MTIRRVVFTVLLAALLHTLISAQQTGIPGLRMGASYASLRGRAADVQHHEMATGDLVSVLTLTLPDGTQLWKGVSFNVVQAWFEQDTLMAVHLQLTEGPDIQAAYNKLKAALGQQESSVVDAGVHETTYKVDGLTVQLTGFSNAALDFDDLEAQMDPERMMEADSTAALANQTPDSVGSIHVMLWNPIRYLRTLMVALDCNSPMVSPTGLYGIWKVQDMQGMFADIGRFAQFYFDNGVMHFISADRLRQVDFRYTISGSLIRLKSLSGPQEMEFCATLNRNATLVLENSSESVKYVLER